MKWLAAPLLLAACTAAEPTDCEPTCRQSMTLTPV
jgi:hypothetical protein